MGNELNPREFLDRRESGEEMTLLDVREDWEVALAPVPTHTVHIPMATLSDRIGELDPNKETVVICRSGGRSAQVAQFLERQGFGVEFVDDEKSLLWSKVVFLTPFALTTCVSGMSAGPLREDAQWRAIFYGAFGAIIRRTTQT